MARTRNTVSENHLIDIKKHISNAFGKPVTYAYECESISKDILKVTGTYVSPQTLRRVFGFVKSAFSPAPRTLNALAAYTGFSHWEAFTNRQASRILVTVNTEVASDFLLEFYAIDLKEEKDMNYHNAARNLALRILANPPLLSKLISSLAANPVSQVYFFERFPFIDGLCTDYKRGLKLYLQKKAPEAQVFGISLLFLSAFLSGRTKDMTLKIRKLNAIQLHDSMHPFTMARYIGSNILYQSATGGHPDYWITQVHKWNRYFMQKRNMGFWAYPYFQHMIADYLNLAGMYRESHSITRTCYQLYKTYEIEAGYSEALEVIHHIGKHTASSMDYLEWISNTKAFDSINPLFTKFYQLQAKAIEFTCLAKDNRKEKTKTAIMNLVDQTGFTFFLKFLQ